MKVGGLVKRLLRHAVLLGLIGAGYGCALFPAKIEHPALTLPFIKNSGNECYFLDEFMPVPDGMVTGKSGSMSLRYYTYKYANYKDWENKQVILSFYSNDDRCWSLFEEYYVML